MEDHFFSYNAIQKTWQETNCHELSGTLAEYVPQIILIENKEQMVWCPIHHTYETVETLSHSKVSTTDGCILSGAVIPIGAIDITADQDARRDLFDLRWHISQERSRGRLMIAVDRVVIGLGDGYDNRLGRVLVPHVYGRSFHSISVAYVKEKIIEIGLCQKIPTTILITALTKLQGIAEEYYGEKMPFSWEKIVSYGQYSDPECLKAMLHYPFSPILWLMRNYFNINENYRIVTRDDRRGFSKICEALQLVSNEAFLSQVLKNPYTFILNLRLRRLGFQDECLIESFYGLKTFCGKEMDQRLEGEYVWENNGLSYDKSLFEDDAAMAAFRKDKLCLFNDWEALFFYCQWNLQQSGEDVFSPIFYRLLAEWQPCYTEALRSLHRYYLDLPLNLRASVLENGLSPQICLHINELLEP